MLRAILPLTLLLVALVPPAVAGPLPELRVSAIPDENPQELLRIYQPFAEYLARELKMPVRFVPVLDYAATVEALAAEKLEMVWYGGFTSVQAVKRTRGNAKRLVLRQEDAEFKSVFITRPATGIMGLGDLRGRTFSFGSVSSTSGHLMPRFFLLKEGINPDKDFSRIAFSGAHDATVAFVASGRAEAGVLNASVFDKLAEKGDAKAVRVLATTPPYYDYNWTVRGDLDPALVRKLTAAFLKLDPANPAHKEIMDLQRASKFIATKPENYKGIEEAARSAGLLK